MNKHTLAKPRLTPFANLISGQRCDTMTSYLDWGDITCNDMTWVNFSQNTGRSELGCVNDFAPHLLDGTDQPLPLVCEYGSAALWSSGGLGGGSSCLAPGAGPAGEPSVTSEPAGEPSVTSEPAGEYPVTSLPLSNDCPHHLPTATESDPEDYMAKRNAIIRRNEVRPTPSIGLIWPLVLTVRPARKNSRPSIYLLYLHYPGSGSGRRRG
jgi:hypothetical protein